jgi:hypothetical protein
MLLPRSAVKQGPSNCPLDRVNSASIAPSHALPDLFCRRCLFFPTMSNVGFLPLPTAVGFSPGSTPMLLDLEGRGAAAPIYPTPAATTGSPHLNRRVQHGLLPPAAARRQCCSKMEAEALLPDGSHAGAATRGQPPPILNLGQASFLEFSWLSYVFRRLG